MLHFRHWSSCFFNAHWVVTLIANILKFKCKTHLEKHRSASTSMPTDEVWYMPITRLKLRLFGHICRILVPNIIFLLIKSLALNPFRIPSLLVKIYLGKWNKRWIPKVHMYFRDLRQLKICNSGCEELFYLFFIPQ